MNDVELRWLKTSEFDFKLQYRIKIGESFRDWSDWREVPLFEVVDTKENEKDD